MTPELAAYRPRFCVWELTLACNLRCGHCGSGAGDPRPRELSTAEALDTVRQLAELDCRLITLSGGEPTLRADWSAITRAAIARGVAVNMVSNGVALTPELARRMADVGLSNVGISLDGTELIHDRTRGPGSFALARRALEALAAAGVPSAVMTHLNRWTAEQLEEVHDLAVELGARTFRVQLGKPMGRLARRRAETIAPADLLGVMPRLAALKRRSPIEVMVGDSLGYFGPPEAVLRERTGGGGRGAWSGCQAGRLALGIESDGGVKGCLSLQARLGEGETRDPFLEGNLREERLEQIWFDPRRFAFNRHQTVRDLTGLCRRCEHATRCRGGAKCVAAAFTGSLGEDPYCYHRVALQAERRQRGLRHRAAASLVGLGLGTLGLGLGGCGGRTVSTEILDGSAKAPISKKADAGAKASADGGALAPDMKVVCVCPDYGVGLPCTCEPDPCANVCCECDYGLPPPPECCP